MYKITLFYQSNEPGIYTKEEETATDLHWANVKKERMLTRWFGILCPHIDFDSYIEMLDKLNLITKTIGDERNQKIYELKYGLMQKLIQPLNNLNEKFGDVAREFQIKVEKC
jgi:hypothetical protein